MEETPALEAIAVTKYYGNSLALYQATLQIPQGSFFGIVGPNGAGKSTLLSIMTGLLEPTSGQSYVLGQNMWVNPEAAKEHLGVLPSGMFMFERLSAIQHLTYVAILRGVDEKEAMSRALSLLETFELPTDKKKAIGDYSTGMRKKLGLALALISKPKVVVLDEPFEAVDPVSAATLQKTLRTFTEAGGTVVLSSHVMGTVQDLCSHIAVINKGQVLCTGTTQQIAAGKDLGERFLELVGGEQHVGEELNWLSH